MVETRSAEETVADSHEKRDSIEDGTGLHPGDVLAGKYRVERILGQGAMGVVFSATHLALGGLVAVKVLSPRAAHRRGIARLQREARATAAIRSEHVARVMDVGTIDNDKPFLVMEYLEGLDAAAALRNRGPFSIVDAVSAVVEACDALAAAHVMGVVHRDLKPSNLFFAHQLDGSTRLKVVDFGLAKMPEEPLDGRLTSATAVMGSPHYMAPEQITNPREVDARADIWSLGVILYELVTGRKPFDGSSTGEIFASISTHVPEPPSRLRTDLPTSIEALILGCLEKNPRNRPAHVGMIAEKLAPFGSAATQLLSERIGRVIGNIGAKEEPSVGPSERVRPGATADDSTERSKALSEGATASSAGIVPKDFVRAGMVLGGRFRVEKLLGRGAMGTVYEVADEQGAPFAVKLLPVETSEDPEARKRLLREARLASTLSHDHVVNVIDVCIDERGDAPFIVMELLEGKNLAEALQITGALSPKPVAKIFRQVCQALAAAHAHGLVHRDVKPANIFLHQSNPGAITVKLCDFGIAKRTESNALDASAQALTRTGFMLGTPAYMSPEQIKDATAVDARSDIWSVCVSMYEALSGKHPWPHCRTPGELFVAICTEKPVPLEKAAPWIDSSLVAIIMRGFELDPQKRWQTAKELETALARFIDGGDVLTLDDIVSISAEERRVRHDSYASGFGQKRKTWPRVLWPLGILAGVLLGAYAMFPRTEQPLIAIAYILDFVPKIEPSAMRVAEPQSPTTDVPISSSAAIESVAAPPAPPGTVRVREPSREKKPEVAKTVAMPSTSPPNHPAPAKSTTWTSPSGLEMQKGF